MLRYRDPDTGRFVSRESVANNPTNYIAVEIHYPWEPATVSEQRQSELDDYEEDYQEDDYDEEEDLGNEETSG